MLSRAIRRSITGAPQLLPRAATTPTIRASALSTVSHTLEAGNVPEPLVRSGKATAAAKDARKLSPAELAGTGPAPADAAPLPPPTADAPSAGTTPLSDSVRELLPFLKAQTPHYIRAHIHARPYILTLGDTLRLPFLMKDVVPGDVLRLNRATVLGSRDFTLQAAASTKGTRELPGGVKRYLDDRLFVCRAVVTGVESEPMRIMEKTKRRRRHVRHVKSKHKYTVLKISELVVKSPEEVEMKTEAAKKKLVEKVAAKKSAAKETVTA